MFRQWRMRGEYDIAYSLGAPCQVAEQLKRHSLRMTSGPFDWTVLESVPCLISALENRFEGYFDPEHIEIRGRHDHTFLVFDTRYQIMSVHDFPLGEGDPQELVSAAMPAFQEKMRRRIDRFYDSVTRGQKVLFVRYHGSREDTEQLSGCLSALTHGNYKLIMLNETKERKLIEENWHIPNTYAARICQSEDIPWQGCDEHWDRVLQGIRIRGGNASGRDSRLEGDPNI